MITSTSTTTALATTTSGGSGYSESNLCAEYQAENGLSSSYDCFMVLSLEPVGVHAVYVLSFVRVLMAIGFIALFILIFMGLYYYFVIAAEKKRTKK
jgi:hypothetical protein